MVRLKAAQGQSGGQRPQFQFHYGTIKSGIGHTIQHIPETISSPLWYD